jgi:hypothetical protein
MTTPIDHTHIHCAVTTTPTYITHLHHSTTTPTFHTHLPTPTYHTQAPHHSTTTLNYHTHLPHPPTPHTHPTTTPTYTTPNYHTHLPHRFSGCNLILKSLQPCYPLPPKHLNTSASVATPSMLAADLLKRRDEMP